MAIAFTSRAGAYAHRLKAYLRLFRSGAFDSAFYLRTYPDVAAAGVDPLWHFVAQGAREGRDPSAHFCTQDYLTANPDVAALGVNPLLHYLRFGSKENRALRLAPVQVVATPATTGATTGQVAPAAASAETILGPFEPKFSEANLTDAEQDIVDRFHDLYYSKLDEGRGLHTVVLSYFGHELFKCPLDLWIYQELIVRERPDLIIETGTYKGGSAYYLAHICDRVKCGEIISIDINPEHTPIRPTHDRITYLTGSSIESSTFAKVKAVADKKQTVMIILDGDHRCETVLEELRLYHPLVKPGGYLIVEDTNINGHPTFPEFGPGPWEAVEAFLAENQAFRRDLTCERFLLTMNPRGFLRRVA